MLDKIFLSPVDCISSELEKDLATNGAEEIIKRQLIRKANPEFAEYFENVSLAPYTIRNIRGSAPSQNLRRTNTHKVVDGNINKEYINISKKESNSKRAGTSYKLSRKDKDNSNAYSFHSSDNSLNNDRSRSSSPLKERNRKQLLISGITSKSACHQNSQQNYSNNSFRAKPPNVFKDMDLSELIKHKSGMLNLYDKNIKLPTGNSNLW